MWNGDVEIIHDNVMMPKFKLFLKIVECSQGLKGYS
jgi:hypothetical protein